MKKNVLDHIDPKTLGARLQEARKSSGLTQQSVGEEMEMARTTLVAIEKGERRVTPEELIKLVTLYGRSVSEFVGRESLTLGFVPQFRANWRHEFLESQELNKVADELHRLSEDYLELERLCGVSMMQAYPSPIDFSKASPEQLAEEVAAAERNRLGIGDGPITSLRERLETDVGLRIFYFAMPPKISGVFAFNDILGGCIGINSAHPRDRRNWSLAHEYGHFLTNRYQPEITFLSERSRQTVAERFADAFAENFLMPGIGLNRRFTEMHSMSLSGSITLAQICTLADLYRVSVQALVIRLEKLRRFPIGTWDRLEADGFRPRRAQQLLGIDANPPEKSLLPQRYLNLAVLAYDKELLSEGQLAKLLRTDRVSARDLVKRTSQFNASIETGYQSFELNLDQSLVGR